MRSKHKARIGWRKRLNQRAVKLKKGLYILPHLFTFGNAFFGFCSLIFAARGEHAIAAHLILFGALMDMLDGRIARYLGTTSLFGVQLDSLSDVLSFCCAPAFLYYSWLLSRWGLIGAMISFLFVMAGMIRLARFNLIHDKQTLFFLGLPTTMAGCFLVTVLLNAERVTHYQYANVAGSLLIIALSYLMVSTLPFPAFKQRLFKEKKNWRFVIGGILFAIVAVMRVHHVLLYLFLLYFIYAVSAMVRMDKQHSLMERQQV